MTNYYFININININIIIIIIIIPIIIIFNIVLSIPNIFLPRA